MMSWNSQEDTVEKQIDTEGIESDTVRQAAVLRVQMFDSLASDALAILRIQLFVVPLTIALIRFLSTAGESQQSVESIFNEIITTTSGQRALIAVSVAITAVVLSTAVYYIARKKAHSERNYLIYSQYADPSEKLLEKKYHRVKSRTTEILSESIRDSEKSYTEKHSPRERFTLLTDRTNSLESALRVTLGVSLVATLVSAGFIAIGILQTVSQIIAILAIIVSLFAAFLIGVMIMIIVILPEYENFGEVILAYIENLIIYILAIAIKFGSLLISGLKSNRNARIGAILISFSLLVPILDVLTNNTPGELYILTIFTGVLSVLFIGVSLTE
ncbi:hypothetical protein [Halobaculum magnesiiphilum]|uniref:Uncharacterized protein n=1 Tax=Halobaculum magnesiiphilum TaxID=1017351 RepID=A0A8T8WD55_9EURY|nr:hypothetical protein [Halobaculum magnesiiphilum]QZP37770.1 hypothetical protein K6T50_00890 [Halobaculum magnesiiphilum]